MASHAGAHADNTQALSYVPVPPSNNPPAAPPGGRQESSVEADGWKTLMAALMAIFKPIVNGWGAACQEAKRWKEQTEAKMAQLTEAKMAELHKQKNELGTKHESQVQVLEQKLKETEGLLKKKTKEAQDLGHFLEAKQRESEAQRKDFHSAVAELQKKAEVHAEAHKKEAEERKREVESLVSQVQVLEQKLAETQDLHKIKTEEAHDLGRSLEAKHQESEAQRQAFHSTAADLHKKFTNVEADAEAAKEAHRKEAEERKREAEEAKLLHEKLQQEADKKERAHAEEILKLRGKIKESETSKSKLEEELRAATTKNTSLVQELAQKNQDYLSLESRFTAFRNRNRNEVVQETCRQQ